MDNFTRLEVGTFKFPPTAVYYCILSRVGRYVLTAAHCTCTDKLKCNNGKAEYNAKEEFVGELFKYYLFLVGGRARC